MVPGMSHRLLQQEEEQERWEHPLRTTLGPQKAESGEEPVRIPLGLAESRDSGSESWETAPYILDLQKAEGGAKELSRDPRPIRFQALLKGRFWSCPSTISSQPDTEPY